MTFALGTIPLGTTVSPEDSFAILDRFAEAGGTMLDTANNYPFWNEGCTGDESEATIGAWLAARGNRDGVYLSTKGGARPTVPGDRTLASAEGVTGKALRAAIEGSLKRLGVDHVDLYWTHIEDRETPLEDTLEALDEFHRTGKILKAGSSNMPAWRVEQARGVSRAHGWLPYTHLQLRFTYLQPRPGALLREMGHKLATAETLGYVRHAPDLTLWAYNTLMFGSYTNPDKPIDPAYDHQGSTERLKVLRGVAAELGATVNQVVLAWHRRQGIVPIVGVTRMEQLEEAIGAAQIDLDDELFARLEDPA
ncbi:aldo/keto reductase [Nonomuraea soli]|uniref:Aryl-alcohol dehydrogenase-like predicted oxidoreductase n=1 Tax=Nonomuraea soli TaxID=1032476 RepID=A0A7W0CN06_9ACTN|nr:aldo/keto reductase [Nonomuraea soli]MBA2893945.1 aryl-alcohol dehydrogenase-like predicted oxidoreductase [Nonomuraea soli]